jgi:hypothetical protein
MGQLSPDLRLLISTAFKSMYKAGETSIAFLAGFHNLLEIVPGDTYLSKHFVITYHQAEENWAISIA